MSHLRNTTRRVKAPLTHSILADAVDVVGGATRRINLLVVGDYSVADIELAASKALVGGRFTIVPFFPKEERALRLLLAAARNRFGAEMQFTIVAPVAHQMRKRKHWLGVPSHVASILQHAGLSPDSQIDAVVVNARGFEAHVVLALVPFLERMRPFLFLRFCDGLMRQRQMCSNFLLQWCKSLGYEVFVSRYAQCADLNDLILDSEKHPGASYQLCMQPRKLMTARTSCVDNGGDVVVGERSKLKALRYLFAHFRYPQRVQPYHDERLRRLRSLGFQVEDFVVDWPREDFVGQTSPPSWALFPDIKRIDLAWRRSDRMVLSLYERLSQAVERADVLISLSGAGLHPDFVSRLKCFKVFTFFNDPESDAFSAFFAPAYDYAFTGNVNCVQMYRSWGIRNVSWLPGAVADLERDTTLTEDKILSSARDINTIFLGERDPHRDLMLLQILKRFPKTVVRGDRWPSGFVSNREAIRLYQRSRLSWSIDQSVGPTSNRNYRVPANGTLLIAHNRHGLDQLYNLGKEAIGFDTVDKCIEYTRYYLCHEVERRGIAVNGWKRAMKDYTFEGVWNRLLSLIAPHVKQGVLEWVGPGCRPVPLPPRRKANGESPRPSPTL